MIRPWDEDNVDSIEKTKVRVKVAFELMEKLGLEYFCFHDRDIAPEQESLDETNRVLDEIVDEIEEEMKRTGIKLLWGTTNAFSHPRFVSGASTSPNADVFAVTAAQVKKAMVGAGEYETVEEACDLIIKTKNTYNPEPNTINFYDGKYKTYLKLYPKLKDLF